MSPVEGGYLTGVSFASYGPVHELTARVVVAAGLDLAVTAFAGAREPTRELLADGRRASTWTVNHLEPTPREPLTVSARSFFAFADLRVVRADETDTALAWRTIARSYASRITRLMSPGPRTADRLAAMKKAVDPVLAAFSFAKSDINDLEQLNAFDTPVEAALASRKGNRSLVLAGVLAAYAKDLGNTASSELLVCAPERDGPPEDKAAPTPNANRFFYPVVVWRDAKRTLYLDPSRPYTPMGDLTAELNGAACLSPLRHADPRGPFVDLPVIADPAPSFTVDIALHLDAAGDATGTIVGLAQGASASPLRQAFLVQDDERRRIIFEQWLATLMTGARLVDLSVQDADQAEKPMRWTLTIEVPGYARAEGKGLTISRLSKPLATSDFAGVPELAQLAGPPTRSTPLRLLPYAEGVRIVLTWPNDLQVSALPTDLAIDLPGASLSQRVSPGDAPRSHTLTVVRRVAITPGRVTPEQYPAFRQGLADLIRAFESPLRLLHR